MSVPSTGTTQSSSGTSTLGPRRIGAIGAFVWGLRTLVTAPALLAAVLVQGVVLHGAVDGGIGRQYAPLPEIVGYVFQLAITAVVIRYAALEWEVIEGYDELFGGVPLATVRIFFVSVLVAVGLGLVFVVLFALLSPLGALLIGLPAMLLYLVHTILAFSAVSIDRGLVGGVSEAWAVARSARLTLFGLVLLSVAPLVVLEGPLSDAELIVRTGLGTVYGGVLAAGNLAFTRVYLELR